jgi:hypothetical protein
MGASQFIMMGVILGGLAIYHYMKVGRHGGANGYIRHKLGLGEGEQIQAMFMSYYDPDLGALESLVKRGVNYMVALTSAGRVCIGNNEKSQAPMSFHPQEVRIELFEQNKSTLVGPTGAMEPADLILLTPAQGAPFRLLIPRSGGETLIRWAQ